MISLHEGDRVIYDGKEMVVHNVGVLYAYLKWPSPSGDGFSVSLAFAEGLPRVPQRTEDELVQEIGRLRRQLHELRKRNDVGRWNGTRLSELTVEHLRNILKGGFAKTEEKRREIEKELGSRW